ncbi:MAG: phosphoglycerate kinase, partial [Candidatus Buchananbacteria bacterium RIFCSPHIGHO2_01_FULL_40_35]
NIVETGQAPSLRKQINELKNGDILMLENIRFDKREEAGDKNFAQELAKLGDIYINDAFGVCHRDQASVSTIQDYLPSYAGLLLENELKNLSAAIDKLLKPLTVIIGGAKISTKIKLIQKFLKIADHVLLGGALANTVLHVMGVAVGKSLVEPKMYPVLRKIKLTDNQLRVPLDGVMAKSYQAKVGRLDALADVQADELILDVGPDTIKLYEKIIKSSKMIIWNGPMGLIETPFFAKGTKSLVRLLAKSKAKTIVGGGESVAIIRQLGLDKKFSFISTGGGAMLAFLEGKKLPGLKKIATIK